MLDLIFVVRDPEQWHRDNLRVNRTHYAPLMRCLGAKAVARVQQMGPGVYFNPMVTLHVGNGLGVLGPGSSPPAAALASNQVVKYGVVSCAQFRRDLADWSSLYVAGRLHKPVGWLSTDASEAGDDYWQPLLRHNLRAALSASMLLLAPGPFTRRQLYHQIASLSYQGDIRMGIAENPNKIGNIVDPNVDQFEALYGALIEELAGSADKISIEDDRTRALLLANVPEAFRAPHERSLAAVQNHLREQLHAVVRQSSRQQTAKGFFTAGPLKSVLYGWAKLMKRFSS